MECDICVCPCFAKLTIPTLIQNYLSCHSAPMDLSLGLFVMQWVLCLAICISLLFVNFFLLILIVLLPFWMFGGWVQSQLSCASLRSPALHVLQHATVFEIYRLFWRVFAMRMIEWSVFLFLNPPALTPKDLHVPFFCLSLSCIHLASVCLFSLSSLTHQRLPCLHSEWLCLFSHSGLTHELASFIQLCCRATAPEWKKLMFLSKKVWQTKTHKAQQDQSFIRHKLGMKKMCFFFVLNCFFGGNHSISGGTCRWSGLWVAKKSFGLICSGPCLFLLCRLLTVWRIFDGCPQWCLLTSISSCSSFKCIGKCRFSCFLLIKAIPSLGVKRHHPIQLLSWCHLGWLVSFFLICWAQQTHQSNLSWLLFAGPFVTATFGIQIVSCRFSSWNNCCRVKCCNWITTASTAVFATCFDLCKNVCCHVKHADWEHVDWVSRLINLF